VLFCGKHIQMTSIHSTTLLIGSVAELQDGRRT